MSEIVSVEEAGYTCEDYVNHTGDRNATVENPIIYFRENGMWRCVKCLVIAINVNDEGREVACAGCGTMTATAFCDASCALGEGYDGGHDCSEDGRPSCDSCYEPARYCSAQCAINEGDDRPACVLCGEDEGRYCSADCGLSNGDTLHCSECGADRNATSECPKCRSARGAVAEREPATLAAADNVTQPDVNDDGSVVVGGITIRF